MIELNI